MISKNKIPILTHCPYKRGKITFTRSVLISNYDGAKCAVFNDLDGDGDIDIVGCAFHDSTSSSDVGDLSWWISDEGTPNPTYVAASFCGNQNYDAGLCWYENDGSENFTWHKIMFTDSNSVGDIALEDVDEDGRIDIVAALGNANKVSWFRNIDDDNLRLNPENNKPDNPYLLDSYPNPFNAITTISFSLPCSGNTMLEVYNLMGQKVDKLVGDWMEAGNHSIQWDAEGYSSGIYFYKLTVGDNTITKRMTLLK